MGREDWHRNDHWDPEIEAHFFEKLRRARDKAQYVKIQAGCLARNEPRVALWLLEHFDEFKSDRSDLWLADVHNTAAEAYLALGLVDQAIVSFKAAWSAKENSLITALAPGRDSL